jgi:outer membrane protein assembly factor BamB
MAITTPAGNPAVVNVLTGAVEWTAPVRSVGMAASDTTLLAVADDELVAYRVGTGEPLWSAPFDGAPEEMTVVMTATTAVVYSTGYPATGYDLATGKAWLYGEEVRQSTPSWLAVCAGVSCSAYAIR